MGDIYVGVNGQPKKVIGVWVGVNGVPKKVKNAWVGVGNTPKVIYVGLGKAVVTGVDSNGTVYWEAATGAVRYKVKKYNSSSRTWITSSVFTANTYYTLASFDHNITKVAVIAYDARTSTANTTTSDEYIIPWVTITFDGNGGTPDENYRYFFSGDRIGTLPGATRSGYDFEYWADELGYMVYSSTRFYNDETLTAQWESLTTYYTITLDAETNGGYGGGDYDVESGSRFYLSDYEAEKDGYEEQTSSGIYEYWFVFKGWYTSASGGTKKTSITVTEDATYYAQFTTYSSIVLGKPTGLTVSGRSVSWNAATGATSYIVYKNGNKASTAEGTTYSRTTTNTYYNFDNTSYMYKVWVVACDDDGHRMSSDVVYPNGQ